MVLGKIRIFVFILGLAGAVGMAGCVNRPLSPVSPVFIPPTPTATQSLGVASPSPTASATASPDPTRATSTPSPTSTGTPSMTPSSSPTPTATFSATSSPTASPAGSSTAVVSATATASPSTTPGGLDVPANGLVSMGAGNYSYSYIYVHSGGTLYVYGPVTFSLSSYFAMDAGATFYEDEGGAAVGEEAGSPSNLSGASGAGHGGAGGSDQLGNAGGAAYDSTTMPALPGSMGAKRNCTIGGYGGGMISVLVPAGPATLNGLITLEGVGSAACGSPFEPFGAGSGGGLFIQADTMVGGGLLRADGGAGMADGTGVDNSGGGGGGIIVLSTHTSNNFTGTTSVQGGTAVSPAQPGQAGVFNTTTF